MPKLTPPTNADQESAIIDEEESEKNRIRTKEAK